MPQKVQHFFLPPALSKLLRHKKAEKVFFVIDETQPLKRPKKMAGVGKLFHHASGGWRRIRGKGGGKRCGGVRVRLIVVAEGR